MFFCVKLSAIRAFSTFAFELDFIRSLSFSLSSQPAKAQSLSAVARLHTHESFWNVLGFTHQRNSLHGGVFHWKIMRVCVAQRVDPRLFFLSLCLIFVASKSLCRHNALRNSALCMAECSCDVLGCNLAQVYLGPPSTHCLSLPSCIYAAVMFPSSTLAALPVEFPPGVLCTCHCCSPFSCILRCGPEVISTRINRGL